MKQNISLVEVLSPVSIFVPNLMISIKLRFWRLSCQSTAANGQLVDRTASTITTVLTNLSNVI